MATNGYDAIVVGARCAGSPTAMLLARKGYKVLLLDKDRFPSDTLSTHMVHPPGIARLKEWGLLDRLVATGCPAIERYKFDFGFFKISGRPAPAGDVGVGYGPRRLVLDKLLVDAAAEAGAEVRESFTVDEILIDDGVVTGVRGRTQGGQPITEHARIVIGADGRHSLVAKAVGPEQYNDKPILESAYYTYWSNLPVEGFEVYVRPQRGWGTIPTHDGLTLVVQGWPYAEFEKNKTDVEGNYMRGFELAPEFAERVRAAKREAPFRGAGVPNFFRKPFGGGWALVGDAGYTKDPVTAWGMSDAFRDAALCSTALDQWFAGTQPFDEAMSAYQQQRDEHSLPMFGVTCNFATLEPPPPEMQQVLKATSAKQDSQDQFVSMMAGTLPVPAFFAPENVGRIMAAAGAQA
jgi:flavin-dependent dehydrogenase